MAQLTYEREITGFVVIDLYNDFISEGGRIWDRIKGVAEGNQCVPHMIQVLEATRKSGIRVFYAMHRRYRPGDYETWKYIAPIQRSAWRSKAFGHGKKHGIHELTVMGLIAHTCVEATIRFAAELGYEITMVKDATADYSDKEMQAALEVNFPNYASAIVTTDEIVSAISFGAGVEIAARP